MSKRLIEIDDDLLERARRASGQPTIRATVEVALKQLLDNEDGDMTVRHIRWLAAHPLDLDMVEEARRPRVPLDT